MTHRGSNGWITARLRVLLTLRGLPIPVGRFYLRARHIAGEIGDDWSFASATPPQDLATIIRLAGSAREVTELGTGTAWGTIALALADKKRMVTSYDPVIRPTRDRYLALVDSSVRARIRLVPSLAETPPVPEGPPPDFIFIDSSHTYEETRLSFLVWEKALRPAGMIVFHDYGNPRYPGVADAIADLGLSGEAHGLLYAWRKPASHA